MDNYLTASFPDGWLTYYSRLKITFRYDRGRVRNFIYLFKTIRLTLYKRSPVCKPHYINKCCPNLSSFLASWPLSCRQNQEPGKCPAFCMSAVWVSAAVLNLLRLEDHLQIVSLGGGPPLKIEMDNFKN